ncbi:MAG: ATP-binding protein, partial [bacterium]
LWFSGVGGLGRYRNREYHKHGPQSEQLQGFFYSLLELEDGRIWAGGMDKIVEFDGETWKIVSHTGFGHVNNLLRRHDGSFWAASHTGVHQYVEGSWVANTNEDGLPAAHSYMLFEDSQSRLWAGTAKGLVLYHPEADPDPPRTYIPPEENLTETPPGGNVRFVYSGMDRWKYTEADRLMFSHRFDEDPWSAFTSETIASATGLSSGQHRFEVKAVDRNWNVGDPASFEFTVLVPWYTEPMFLVVFSIGSAIILILLGLHIYHHFNLERLVNRRTTDLRKAYSQLQRMASDLSLTEERERRQLATDLHDSISQSLSVSMMELSAMDQAETVNEFKEQAGNIRERLDEAFQTTQNLTFNLCPPELYQVGLESAIRELTVRTQKKHSVEIAFDDDGRPKPVSEDVRYFLFRAARELLLNVIKHARATAVRVSIKRTNGDIRIQISDDGVGFEWSDQRVYASERGAFGLFSIRQRVSQIGGSLQIQSEPGAGTRVTIVAPLNSEEKGNGG